MKILKKLLVAIAMVACALFAFGCGVGDTTNSESLSSETPDGHLLTAVEAKAETCTEDGNVLYYECSHCDKYFADENATFEISAASVVIKASHRLTKTDAVEATCTLEGSIEYYTCSRCEKHFSDSQGKNEINSLVVPATGHSATKIEAVEATCTEVGNVEYYACSSCGKFYLDEECKNEVAEEDVLLLAEHKLTYHEATAPSGKTNGNIEYWSCSVCENNYATEDCIDKLTEEDVIILSALNVPDFLVEVEEGRDPVVLQLSDTQIWSWGDTPEVQCYRYIREVVEKTNPDLIILTGDLVYGKYDPNGALLTSLINFMETLDILWAPVFGNHDNESLMGVDWQCQQLEEAENCLFKQGDVTGNGNYSVGIEQGGKLLRVFYMMDSNGCGNPMIDSNGVHTAPTPGTNVVQTNVGFGADQIAWYTNSINAIHAVDEDVKISFAYHIQQAIFESAFEKYAEYNGLTAGGSSSVLANPLNLDTLEGADDTDFGYLGRRINAPWDMDNTIFNGMKALGCDSIFVGHEHCNSVSIVYDGVRFQYGQKSSTYDRYNSISEDGTITGAYEDSHPVGSHPLLGGSVIPISSVDGSIGTGYICYAGNPFNFDPKADISAWENAGAKNLGSALNSSEALDETFGGLAVYKTNGGYGQSIVNKSIDSSNYSELYFAFKATAQVTLSNGDYQTNVITPNTWYFVKLEKQEDGSWAISTKKLSDSYYTPFVASTQFFGAGNATFETMFRTYLWTADTFNHEVYATDVWGVSIVGGEIATWENAGAVNLGSAINSSEALSETLGGFTVYKTNGGYGQSIVNTEIDASNYTELHFAFKADKDVMLSNGDYGVNMVTPNTWYFVKLEKQEDGSWTISSKKVGDSDYVALTASEEFFGAGKATFDTMFKTYLWIADAMQNNHEVYATDVWGK